MERKVIRIITPGTVSDEALLSERQDNLIAAVYHDGRRFGYGTMDIGSYRFINQFEKEETLLAELQRTNPAELLYPESFAFLHHVEGRRGPRRRPEWEFELGTARKLLCQQFGTQDLVGFGVEQSETALRRRLPHAIRERHPAHRPAPHSQRAPRAARSCGHHGCGHPPQSGADPESGRRPRQHPLRRTGLHRHSHGQPLAQALIHQPIRDRVILKGRQSTIKELIEQNLYDELGGLLRQVGDVERVLARLALRSARPRDLTRLRQAFAQLPELQRLLAESEHEAVQQLRERASTFPNCWTCWSAP